MKPGRPTRPPGLSTEALALYKDLANLVGYPVLAIGSRYHGYWVDTSDYDAVILAPSIERLRLRHSVEAFAKARGIKLDFAVNHRVVMPGQIVEVDRGA